MAKANHKKQLLNFVSHREFWYIRHSELGTALINKFANDLGRRVGAQANMRTLMEQIYGDRWYDEPYGKLYKLAKLAVPKSGPSAGYYPTPLDWHPSTVGRIHEWQRHKASIYDSYRYRMCKRYYKSSTIDELVEQCSAWNDTAGGYNSIEGTLEKLLYYVVYARKLDKQCLKKLKKVNGQNELRVLADAVGNVHKFVNGCYSTDITALPVNQRNEFLKTLLNANIDRYTSGDVDEEAWAEIIAAVYEKLGYQLGRLTAYYIGKNQYKATARAMKECEKVKDTKRICDKLGLSITGGNRGNRPYITWRMNKVNHKSYRLLKQLEKAYDSGTDKQSIQALAKHRTHSIYSSTYTPSAYTPVIYGFKD